MQHALALATTNGNDAILLVASVTIGKKAKLLKQLAAALSLPSLEFFRVLYFLWPLLLPYCDHISLTFGKFTNTLRLALLAPPRFVVISVCWHFERKA